MQSLKLLLIMPCWRIKLGFIDEFWVYYISINDRQQIIIHWYSMKGIKFKAKPKKSIR